MVAELRDRLAADGHPVLRMVADAIDPVVRNAAAHEDVHFDELTGRIAAQGFDVEVSKVIRLTDVLLASTSGFDLAVSCARARFAAVGAAYELRPGDPRSASALLGVVEQRFGHAGLRVWSVRRDRDRVDVVLDDLDPRSTSPCFLSLCQAHQWLPAVQRWLVWIRGRQQPVIDLPSAVAAENVPIFERAAQLQHAGVFDAIPVVTFLPCDTWARLSVQLPGPALRAAAWIALNDAQHAIEEAEEVGPSGIRTFAAWIDVGASATASTLRTLPVADAKPLEVAHRLLSDLADAAHGMGVDRLPQLVQQVKRERDMLIVPAPLPTLDSRPLDVLEAQEGASD